MRDWLRVYGLMQSNQYHQLFKAISKSIDRDLHYTENLVYQYAFETNDYIFRGQKCYFYQSRNGCHRNLCFLDSTGTIVEGVTNKWNREYDLDPLPKWMNHYKKMQKEVESLIIHSSRKKIRLNTKK